MATRIESAYDEARTFYAELGVDTDAAHEAPRRRPDLAPLLAGRRRRRLRERRRRARRRPRRHRQLSRQGPHARRAARRPRRRRCRSIPGTPPPQPARLLRRVRRQDASTATRFGPEHFAGWIDWAEVARHRPGLQPDLLLAPEGRRRLHALASRRRRSASSGSTTASPAAGSARRSARRSARPASPTSGSPTAARTRPSTASARANGSTESLDAIFEEPIDPAHNLDAVEGKLFGIGSRELRRRLARVLSRLRAVTRKKLLCLDAGHFHPTETIADKISARVHVPAGDPAARQPRRPLGQRPRRHPHRRAPGDQPGARARRLPRPHAHRPRLLRRQHQPRRRLGHRHAQHAQGAAHGAARTDRHAARSSKPPATTPPAWRCSKRARRCPSARSGTTTANSRTCPAARRGWQRCRKYEKEVLSRR